MKTSCRYNDNNICAAPSCRLAGSRPLSSSLNTSSSAHVPMPLRRCIASSILPISVSIPSSTRAASRWYASGGTKISMFASFPLGNDGTVLLALNRSKRADCNR